MAERADDSTDPTHAAYGLKRQTRVTGRWLDIGLASLEIRSSELPPHLKHLVPHLPELLRLIHANVFLDRTIIGAFSGHVLVTPIGRRPADIKPSPKRPGETDTKDMSLSEEDM